MSKAISYYDWEQSLRKKTPLHNVLRTRDTFSEIKLNSLGLSDVEFKDFMKKWKEDNL